LCRSSEGLTIADVARGLGIGTKTFRKGGPRVLAVIATSLVGGVVCGSLIGWFLRFIKCSGRAWLLGSSLMMLRSQPAAIANRAAVGWLRRAGSDLVGVEACGVGV
jgi:integral membrane sensor domain MASE1